MKRKKLYSLCSLMLALVLLLSCLSACGNGDGDGAVTTASNPAETTDGSQKNPTDTTAGVTSQDTTTAPALWESKNFGGDTIRIAANSYSYADYKSAADMAGAYPDENDFSTVSIKIYDRNNRIGEQLGITVDYVTPSLGSGKALPYVEELVLGNAANAPDLVIAHNQGLLEAGLKGYLCNVLDESEDSYFEFDRTGWYTDYMKGLSVSDDHMYVLGGDYFLDLYRCIYAMFVNVTLYDELFSGIYGGIDELYETVNDGDWTYDLYTEICQAAFSGTGNDPNAPDDGDRLGSVISLNYSEGNTTGMAQAIFFSADTHLIQKDENGNLFYPALNTVGEKLAGKLIDLLETNAVLNITDKNRMLDTFAMENTVFMNTLWLSYLETPQIQNMGDVVTVMPIPKVTDTDRYCATIASHAAAGGILKTTDKFAQTSAFVQAATENSRDAYVAYFEMALKFQYTMGVGNAIMLDVLYDNIHAETSRAYLYEATAVQLLGNTVDFYVVDFIETCVGERFNSFGQKYASSYEAKQTALSEWIANAMQDEKE